MEYSYAHLYCANFLMRQMGCGSIVRESGRFNSSFLRQTLHVVDVRETFHKYIVLIWVGELL